MNVINLVGRISTDLELKTTTNGKSVCDFNLAINRIADDTTDFIPCRVWEKTAENLCRYKTKGEQIALEGSLVWKSYVNSNNERKYFRYVLVKTIEYIGSKNSQNETSQAVSNYQNEVETNSNSLIVDSDDEVQLSPDDLPF